MSERIKDFSRKNICFLLSSLTTPHHNSRSWLSASVFSTKQSRPHHCHLPPSLVSEFPFLICFYFLVPLSICGFPLVMFLPSFESLWRIHCLHCLDSGKDVSEISHPWLLPEAAITGESTFFDFGQSMFSPGWRWCTHYFGPRQEMWRDRTCAVTLCGWTASSLLHSNSPEKPSQHLKYEMHRDTSF